MTHRALIFLWALTALVACATIKNTPAQDLAWERWKECDKFPQITLKEIRADGQIWVWHKHGVDLAKWQECEREARARQQRAGKLTASPSAAPEPKATPAREGL